MSESKGERMHEKEYFWKPHIPETNAIPLKEKERVFYTALESFPQEAQELVASLSSSFLEEDIYNEFKKDKESVSGLRTKLKDQGLKPQQINQVMEFFGLPSKIQRR